MESKKEENREKSWIMFKKRLDSLPDPYKCAFEKFVVGIGKMAKENELQSISDKILKEKKKEYQRTNEDNKDNKRIWKKLEEKAEETKTIGAKKENLKRYMSRPVKDGGLLDLFSEFFNMDKREIVYGLKFNKRKDEFLGREVKYLAYSEVVEEVKKERKKLEEKKGLKKGELEKKKLEGKIKELKEEEKAMEENFERLIRQQNDIKSRFISLDGRIQNALILLVQEVSVLLHTEE